MHLSHNRLAQPALWVYTVWQSRVLGFQDLGPGFRVFQGLGAWILGFSVQGQGIWGLGLRVQGYVCSSGL